MKNLITILILLLLLGPDSSCSGIQPRIFESLSMESSILGQELKYSIILPENYYESAQRYPVVYLLHGLGDDETSWMEYGRVNQVADRAVQDGEIVPMIFVIPQGFRNYYVNDYAGTFPYQDMFIRELIPFIDSSYRTKAEGRFRATLGYSMGGFGALAIPLKNPDHFSACVPLSISIRTDEQYMVEDASEWNDQWGRLFGGTGTTGEARITGYYKQNCPFHIIARADRTEVENLRIYIDNGDDEQTLAFSNEELHILLRDKQIPHEFRVRNGGHSFSYWREALPNGLRFISDAFENKPYRGDIKEERLRGTDPCKELRPVKINGTSFDLCLPEEYPQTTRLYPVIFVLGDLTTREKEWMSGYTRGLTAAGEIPPLMLAFISSDEKQLMDDIIPELEKEYRLRKGYRFRALIGFESGGSAALNYALTPETFTSCALIDASVDYETFRKSFQSAGAGSLQRTWFYISYPDKGMDYAANGRIHMDFRATGLYHEYRVREGSGGFEWAKKDIREILIFSSSKIHR